MALLNWAPAPNHLAAYEGCGGPGALLELNPSGDSAFLSEDGGVTWPEYSLPTMGGGWTKPFYSWEIGLYLVFNYNGDGTQYATSPDGKVWTLRTFPAATYGSVVIREGDGHVVVIYSGVFWYSTDMITWASTTPTSGGDIAFGNGYWVIPSGTGPELGGNHLYYCMALGDAWVPIDFTGEPMRSNRIAFGAGYFLCPSSTASALKRFATPIGAMTVEGLPSPFVISTAAQFFDHIRGTALSVFLADLGVGNPILWSATGLSDSWEEYDPGLAPYSFMWNETVAYMLGDTGSIITALEAGAETHTIEDGVAFGSIQLIQPVKIVRDGVALNGDAQRLYTAVMRSIAAMASAQAATFDGTSTVSDTAAFGSRLAYVFHVLVQEGLVLGGDAVPEYKVIARAVSRLLMQGMANNTAEAVIHIVDALVMAGVVATLARAEAIDSVAMRVLLDSLYSSIGRAIARVLMADTAAGVFTATALISDTVAMGSLAQHAAELVAAVRDGVGFATTIMVDNFEYIAWVVNTQSKAHWRYTNYPFNSFAKINGRYYGAGVDGIHDLEAEDDADEPIAWRIRLGMAAGATRKLKRYPEAFIAVRGDGEMFLKVITVAEQTGEKQVCIYRMAHRNAPERWQKIGRGLQSVEWDWELAGAGTVELSALQFYPLVLDRRTRG